MPKLYNLKKFETNQFNYFWSSVIFPTIGFIFFKQPSKLFNVMLAVLEKKFKKTKLACKPFIYKIEASSICNLKCPYCVTAKREQYTVKEKWIVYPNYLVIHNKIKKSALRVSFYIFGEAMVNPDLTKIIQKASDDHIFTYFSTNFNLATPEKIRELTDAGLGEVAVALDGWTQEKYAKYRVGGNVETVKNAIQYLMQYKKEQQVKWPLLKVNTIKFDHVKDEIEKIKNFCIKTQVDSFVLKPNLEHVPCNSGPKPYSSCFWVWYTLFIDTDGYVYPCQSQQRKRDFYYGNIFKDDLNDIWNSDMMIKMRNFLVGKSRESFSANEIPCIDCELYDE